MSKTYEVVTEKIAAMLAGGKIPWRRPWCALRASGNTRPRNVAGNLYRGANWFLLGTFETLSRKTSAVLGGSMLHSK
ncbi:ArdC family protein [Geothrix sp. PMB-07]|uniref:ArdC family protein n=1 Tax=Geothrix sp. PMB-07 TaxID=3068640 RepID=UPI002740E8AF|nr:ArdC family protein [Geothrix sp. PMB-07]WLT30644.1 ArdC family protein [Geothrix sp. PMB-07]